MMFRRRNSIEPEPTEEIIEVQLYPPEPEPPKEKAPVAGRLALFAIYGGLSYVTFKTGEHYLGVHSSIVFELGQSTIAGALATTGVVKAQEVHEARQSNVSALIE